jgi:Transposase
MPSTCLVHLSSLKLKQTKAVLESNLEWLFLPSCEHLIVVLESGYNGPRNLVTERGGNKIYSSMMRKQYTAAFKTRVVQELLREEKTLAQIAAEYEVHPTQLKNWRALALEGMSSLFEKQDSTAELKRAHE